MIDIFSIMNNFILAIVILLVGFIIGRIFGRILLKSLQEAELNNWARKVHIKFSLEDILSKSAEIVVYIITVFLTLNQLGVAKIILSVIFFFIIGVIIASIVLGVRDFVPNYVSGFKVKKTLKKGNDVIIGSIKGKIENINLVEVKIRTQKGDLFLIPYSYLVKNTTR